MATVEFKDVDIVFGGDRKAALAMIDQGASRQEIILEGEIPSAVNPPRGCKFHTRCFKKVGAICASEPPLPLLVEANHHVACHIYSESQVTRYGADEAVEPGRPAAAS